MSDIYDMPHFETGTYNRNSTFLDDPEYSRALDCFVKGCADVLLQDESTGELLIAHRIVHPQPDWWFLGGRMRAGDTPQQAAHKNVKRETGLDLSAERFSVLCTSSLLWQKRKQEPADSGTADIQVAFLARVTPSERNSITWDVGEYDAVKWVAPEEVEQGEGYHPALRRAVSHVLAKREYEALEAAAASGASDAEVAAAARSFLNRQVAAGVMRTLPVPFKDVPQPTCHEA